MLPRHPHRSTSPRGPVPIVLCDRDGAEITTVWVEHWLMGVIGELVADPRSGYSSITDCLAETFEIAMLELAVNGTMPHSCMTCQMLGTPHEDHEFVPQPWATEGS